MEDTCTILAEKASTYVRISTDDRGRADPREPVAAAPGGRWTAWVAEMLEAGIRERLDGVLFKHSRMDGLLTGISWHIQCDSSMNCALFSISPPGAKLFQSCLGNVTCVSLDVMAYPERNEGGLTR